ncbi:MAG: dihydrofolate reductase [Actinomycetia bacterium]|nr:dihydrofolate reductase [Actinomycetes bacterium]
MRKIFSFMAMSVDGYHAGPNQELDWQNLDEEFNAFSLEQLSEVDTLLFGRVTYEVMVAYWPTQQGTDYDTGIAARMNNVHKIVISRTLDKADWSNTRLITDNIDEELAAVKQRPGKDIAIFGSSTLTANLLRMGLVDELRLLVNPIALGVGRTLFKSTGERTRLELLKTRPFKSGNVLLYYRPQATTQTP